MKNLDVVDIIAILSFLILWSSTMGAAVWWLSRQFTQVKQSIHDTLDNRLERMEARVTNSITDLEKRVRKLETEVARNGRPASG